ncbi:MAG TPA: glycosyltransferase family 2 protein [Candidatus Dormibacteraeota bacterium]|nr:glycosyltransferase family 2 protein [Candidatus Dormibacteraeota bacterium]
MPITNSVSIVIPVYNEARHLGACLRAISAQNQLPLEVIVVDNNSTDHSPHLVKQFPFATLMHQPKQGVVYARDLGFDAARGTIIARIDADTIVPVDWLENIIRIFSESQVNAVSGAVHYYDISLSRTVDNVDTYFRKRLSRKLSTNFLFGSNMAIRRTDWQKVSPGLCRRGGLHEDFDLAIHLQQKGGKVIYDPDLLAGVSSRRIEMDFLSFMRYALRSPYTYAEHNLSCRLHMYPVVIFGLFAYLPGRVLYKGYDKFSERFSVTRFLEHSLGSSRVDPTTNIA